MNREVSLAWLAGIVEGEGNITINKQHSGVICVTQQNEQFIRNVIELVQELNLPEPHVVQPTERMNSYMLVWSSMIGTLFLQSIRPYFHHPYKITRADIYLKFFKLEDKYKKRLKEEDKEERRLLFEKFKQQQELEKFEKSQVPRRINFKPYRTL